MQELKLPDGISLEDISFEDDIPELTLPEGISLEDLEPTEPTNDLPYSDPLGPRPERATDVYKKTLSETGDKAEAQEAMTDWKIEQQGLAGQGTFGGGDTRAQDFVSGIEASNRGFGQIGIDIGKAIGMDLSQLDEKNQAKIKVLNDRIQDEDFFSAGNLGRLTPTLATLPVTYSSKLLAFLVEGAIGYSETRGTGANEVTSLIGGLITGGGTATVMKAFELLGNKGGKVLDEIRKEFASDIVGKEDKIYEQYAKFVGKDLNDLTNYDKTMAILSQGKEKGAAYFKVAAENDAKAKKALDALSESKKQTIKTAGPDKKSKGMVSRAIKPVEEQQAFASDKYTEFKDLIFGKGPQDIKLETSKDLILDELNNIPDLQKTPIINKVMKKLQGEEQISLEDLFDIREAMNAVTVKMKKLDKKGHRTVDGKEFIDSIISSHMPEEFNSVWTKLKDELSLAYSMKGANSVANRNNVFGKLLTEANQGGRTFESILADISKASDGPKGFNDIMKAIGSDKMKEFEQGLIKEIYSTKAESLGKTVERLKHIGFVTPEGKQLKKQLRLLDDTFSSDDYYKVVADIMDGHTTIDGTSITANLLSKFKYATMSSVWDYMKRLSPTEQGTFVRHMNRVTKAIKEAKPEVKHLEGVTPEMYKDFKNIVRSSVEKTINDEMNILEQSLNTKTIQEGMEAQPKQIGMQPGATQQTVDIGTDVKPVSPEGKVVDDMLEYDSKKLVSNFVDEAMVTRELKSRMGIPLNSSFEEATDKIASRIDNFLPSEKRIQNLMSNYNKEITQAVNTMDRAKIFNTMSKVAENEADRLIKSIEKSIGIKLPKEEADKIITKKIKEVIDTIIKEEI